MKVSISVDNNGYNNDFPIISKISMYRRIDGSTGVLILLLKVISAYSS